MAVDRRVQTHWTFRVEVSPSDKLMARQIIRNEIGYYNALLAGLASRPRTAPKFMVDLVGSYEIILGEVAAHRYNLRNMKPDNLPVSLQPYQRLLFGDGNRRVDEKLVMLAEVFATHAEIHPETRKTMALAMLKFYRDQSALFLSENNRSDQAYRMAGETLESLDHRSKRSFQLPRSSLNIIKKDGDTVVYLPYFSQPFVLSEHIADSDWNLLILRDEDYGSMAAKWTLEISKEPNQYLVKKFDSPVRKPKAA